MPTHLVTLYVTRPPNLIDAELIDLFRQAIERARCFPIEITVRGMVIDADADSLPFLELALRAKLEAQGGSLHGMTVRSI